MRMSTAHLPVLAAIAAFLPLTVAAGASAEALKPFKDDLFSSQTVIESHDNGAFQTIDYQEMRDINSRDQIPEKRVKPAYIATGVRWKAQEDETLPLGDRKLDVTRIGRESGQAFTVIFIHGAAAIAGWGRTTIPSAAISIG